MARVHAARRVAPARACAAFLAVGQVLIGPLTKPLPDLPVIGLTALMPLAIAERIIRAPGAATAVCGAYLLPRATLSLLVPTIPAPPLLLVPALAFDLGLWLDTSHVSAIVDMLPRRMRVWRTRRTASLGNSHGHAPSSPAPSSASCCRSSSPRTRCFWAPVPARGPDPPCGSPPSRPPRCVAAWRHWLPSDQELTANGRR